MKTMFYMAMAMLLIHTAAYAQATCEDVEFFKKQGNSETQILEVEVRKVCRQNGLGHAVLSWEFWE